MARDTPYDAAKFKTTLLKARALTRQEPEQLVPEPISVQVARWREKSTPDRISENGSCPVEPRVFSLFVTELSGYQKHAGIASISP